MGASLIGNGGCSSTIGPGALGRSRRCEILTALHCLCPSGFSAVVANRTPSLRSDTGDAKVRIATTMGRSSVGMSHTFSRLGRNGPGSVRGHGGVVGSDKCFFIPLGSRGITVSASKAASKRGHFFRRDVQEGAGGVRRCQSGFGEVKLTVLLPRVPASCTRGRLSR